MRSMVMIVVCVGNLTAAPFLFSNENVQGEKQPKTPGGNGVTRFGSGVVVLCATGSANVNKSTQEFVDATVNAYVGTIEDSVKITGDQKRQIHRIIESRMNAEREFDQKTAEKRVAAMVALDEAYKSEDKVKLERAEKNCADLFAPEKEAYRHYEDELDEVLSTDQRLKVMFDRASDWTKTLVAPAVLSDAQNKKVKGVCLEIAKGGYDALENRLPREVVRILTPEQVKDIFKYRANGDAESIARVIKLTREQQNQLRSAIDALSATPELSLGWPTFHSRRAQLRSIVEKILTEEQKKALTASRSYNTNFRRPTWGWDLGGPTLSGSGTVVPAK